MFGVTHLAGFGSAQDFTSVSFFNSSTSTSATITLPSSIQYGDLIVIFDRASVFGTVTKVVPTGFTEVGDYNGSSFRFVVSAKIADGSEGGTSVTGMNETTDRKIALVFRGNAPISSFNDNTSWQAERTDGNPAAQTVAVNGQAAPLIALAGYCNSSTRTFSPTSDGEVSLVSGGENLYAQYLSYNTAPGADATVNGNDGGTGNFLGSLYLLLA